MQTYIILMVLAVIGGTLFDVWHKKSAKYFSENTERGKRNSKREVSSSERTGMIVETIKSEVLTSSEFSNPKRRLSHLMTMYGFIIFVATTAIMIFAYPTAANDTPAIWPLFWHLGALSLCVGGYWFWFAIRVDVAAEGHPWYKINPRSDMFILSLLATCTFALLWSISGGVGLFFVLFIASATFLFTTVIWSKFAHMFFKPAAAFEKRVVQADGSNDGLPGDFDLTSKEVQDKFPDIPTYMGETPAEMGPGIRREPARHY
ncbi:MAG: adenylyl-sulfate reductase [Sulfurovum sp.]|nr:MAG: adenylyl-sulfate reductase [Sulfurovum sp.]